MSRRVVICGYFSLPYKTNTVGDLLVLSVLQEWLEQMGIEYDVVSDYKEVISNAIPLEAICMSQYDAMIFVCGPLADFDSLIQFIQTFDGLKKIAINISIVDDKSKIVDLFDYIIPRDSKSEINFDLSLSKLLLDRVPVVGLVFVGPQKEYVMQKHKVVEEIVVEALRKLEIASVYIDTKVPFNEYGLQNTVEIMSVISKMDAIITTRLHGSILSLKAHVPFISIDPISCGAKVSRQMRKIGWPYVLDVDNLSLNKLVQMIQKVLSKDIDNLIRQVEKQYTNNFENEKKMMMKRLENALYEENFY